jgi:hypothetical protein
MRIAIATSFSAWDDTYSLCHVARLHANTLAELGHKVEVWVEEPFNDFDRFHPDVQIRRAFNSHIYQPDNARAEDVDLKVEEFTTALKVFKPDIVIDHDLIFQAAFVAYAEAIHRLPLDRETVWFHVVHSNCKDREPVTDGSQWRRKMPKGHYLLALGEGHRRAVSAHYGEPASNVFICQNPFDFFEGMAAESRQMALDLDLFERDFVQVYPIAGTRMKDKGLRDLIDIFDIMKAEKGQNACLIVCNGHSNNDQTRRDIERVFTAKHLGPDDLVFTSVNWKRWGVEEWEHSVPHRVVADLIRLSNLFIFPSRSEACSLALAEAQAAGCFAVLNEDCIAQMDWQSPYALRMKFGGYGFDVNHHVKQRLVHHDHGSGDMRVEHRQLEGKEAKAQVLAMLCDQIISQVEQNPCLMAKRFAMRTYAPQTVAKRIIDLSAIARKWLCEM